jgi:hypothetical protein
MRTPTKLKSERQTSRSRESLTKQRAYSRGIYYQIIKAIKKANLRGEPIGYLKICELGISKTTTLNKFMRDAEAWGMIEGHPTGHFEPISRCLTVTVVGDAFLTYCETENIKPQSVITERYISRSGDINLTKFNEIATAAKGKRISTRQAAAALVMTRKEFLQLMKENYHPKTEKEASREHYMKHTEEKKQQSRTYYAEHKEEISKRNSQEYARKKMMR